MALKVSAIIIAISSAQLKSAVKWPLGL